MYQKTMTSITIQSNLFHWMQLLQILLTSPASHTFISRILDRQGNKQQDIMLSNLLVLLLHLRVECTKVLTVWWMKEQWWSDDMNLFGIEFWIVTLLYCCDVLLCTRYKIEMNNEMILKYNIFFSTGGGGCKLQTTLDSRTDDFAY